MALPAPKALYRLAYTANSMAKDATPDYIEIKNRDFSNDNHEEVAQILDGEWGPGATIKDISEKYEGEGRSNSLFRNVYYRYLGFDDERQFSDGIKDPRTIEELKKDEGTIKNYIDAREAGEISQDDYRVYLDPEDLEPREPPEPEGDGVEGTISIETALEWRDEARDEAYDSGFEKGFEMGQDVERARGNSALAHEDIFEGVDSD
jgi:hypothetical protein